MLPRHLLQHIRRLHYRARRAIDGHWGGIYRSVFKGAGVIFEEIREYQPGDDVRSIEWNVTARMGHPYVKRFTEERELTLMIVVDVSASLNFGIDGYQKRDIAAELGALLAFCAASNNDKVGLILCSDRVEKFVPPKKGTKHVYRLMAEILAYRASSTGTSLRASLEFLNRVQRRRAIVFLISDFVDRGYEDALRRTGRRHELIGVVLSARHERQLPRVGLVEWKDAETGEQRMVDTSDGNFQESYRTFEANRRSSLRQLAHSARCDLLELSTCGDHVRRLNRFFNLRMRRLAGRLK